MSPLNGKQNIAAGCSGRCCGAGSPQFQYADTHSDARPTSITSTKSAKEQCISGCNGRAEHGIDKCAEFIPENGIEGCASGCCAIQVRATRADSTIASRQYGSGDCNDSPSLAIPVPVKEESVTDGCAGGGCSQQPISVAVEESQVDNCNKGRCGAVDAAPTEVRDNGCRDSVEFEGAQKSKGTKEHGINGL